MSVNISNDKHTIKSYDPRVIKRLISLVPKDDRLTYELDWATHFWDQVLYHQKYPGKSWKECRDLFVLTRHYHRQWGRKNREKFFKQINSKGYQKLCERHERKLQHAIKNEKILKIQKQKKEVNETIPELTRFITEQYRQQGKNVENPRVRISIENKVDSLIRQETGFIAEFWQRSAKDIYEFVTQMENNQKRDAERERQEKLAEHDRVAIIDTPDEQLTDFEQTMKHDPSYWRLLSHMYKLQFVPVSQTDWQLLDHNNLSRENFIHESPVEPLVCANGKFNEFDITSFREEEFRKWQEHNNELEKVKESKQNGGPYA